MNAELREALRVGETAGLRYALTVPRQAPVGLSGGTLSQRAGASLEFRDHRGYEPGDDLRHIDWNAYARSDQLTVKLFREEVTPHLDVVLDASRSMDLEGTKKGAAAAALAAFFAAAAARGGYSHLAWLLADGVQPVDNGHRPPAQWDGVAFTHRGGPVERQPMWRPRGTRVLISDLFWLGDPLLPLRPFADGAAAAVVLHLLARADTEPPVGSSVRLVDAETDEVREIHVDAVVARRYRDGLARHQQNWNDGCRQVGAVFVPLIAEELLARWDMKALVALDLLRVA